MTAAACPKEIVVATRNSGKLREIEACLRSHPGPPIRLLSLLDFPSAPHVDETGDTYEANALLKARSALLHTGRAALADDTGLEVDALEGAPGLRSGRYAGEGQDAAANRRKLLEALAAVPDEARTARFRCVLALAEPGGITLAEGIIEGSIAREPRGEGGFGYDPLFVVAETGRTMAELTFEEKNRLSHRGLALARLVEKLAERDRC